MKIYILAQGCCQGLKAVEVCGDGRLTSPAGGAGCYPGEDLSLCLCM